MFLIHNLFIALLKFSIRILCIGRIQQRSIFDNRLLHSVPKSRYPVSSKTKLFIRRHRTGLVYCGQDAVDKFGPFAVPQADTLGL